MVYTDIDIDHNLPNIQYQLYILYLIDKNNA